MVRDTFPVGRPEQQVTTFEVRAGRLTASVDPLNRRTEYEYDEAGNTTRVTRLAGTSKAIRTTVAYDLVRSLPTSVTDANGNTTTMAYDDRGNLIRITDALGHVTSFTSDAQGRPLTSTDPLGKVVTLTYDGANLIATTDPLGRQVHYVSDAVGRSSATIDALGNRTLFDRDDLDRLTSSTDALGGVTSFSYDPVGRLLSYTDANGHTASYEYNALGQAESFSDALLKGESWQYEPGGRVKQSIDRKGQLRSVTYDAVGRVKTVSFGATAGHPTAYRSRIENTWDSGNRLIQIVDKTCADPSTNLDCASVASVRTIQWAYDDLDRKISEVTPQGEVNYTYDNLGRRASMAIKNGPSGAQVVQPVITYSYDNIGQLTGITQAAGSINAGQLRHVAFRYDAAGRRTVTTLANSSTIAYAYDAAGQLTSIVYKRADGSSIGDLQYEYDAVGHRISMGGSLARIDLPEVDIGDATYDANNRLTRWGGKTFAYDDAGNLTSDGTHTYEWSERGRLDRIRNGAGEIASFQYDSVGRRTSKTIGAVTTGFLHDHDNVVQELDGDTSADPVKAHRLTVGLDATFLRIEGNDGSRQYSVLSDANNNTLMLLDAAQQATVNYTYSPYGTTVADAVADNTQQYAGRDNDNPGVDQGLYYYRARYYMPGIARFISEDPIGWTSGQTNNYAYVGGNPISYRDPLGLSAFNNFVNFSAGFGDGLTFGLTRLLRDALGIGSVDTCSGWYTAGEFAGIVAVTIASAGVSAEAEAVDLYRFVSPAEFEDIARVGKFRFSPGQMEAKQFGRDFDEVLRLSDHFSDAAAIVRVRVPRGVLQGLDLTPVDGYILRSGSVTARGEGQLQLLNDSLIGAIEHIF
jgi:RHS repeat-associated protein